MIEISATVRVIEGLHTRPAAQMAKLMKKFGCNIELVCRGKTASAKSSVKLMLLQVKEGENVLIRADGDEELEAIEHLVHFLGDPQFGVTIDNVAATANDAAFAGACPEKGSSVHVCDGLKGIAGSRGTALGPAHIYLPQKMIAHRQVIPKEEINKELNRFRSALAGLESKLSKQSTDQAQRPAALQDRAILQALIEVAQDEEYVGAIIRGIEAQGDAGAVTLRVGELLAATFEAMTDDYMRARSEDIRGVTRQLAAVLLGQSLPDLGSILPGAVLVANELSAWEFSKVPIANVRGLVCIGGASTSHVAIMARTHGIPAVLGVPLLDEELQSIQCLVVDGDHGEVIINPTETQKTHYLARIACEALARKDLSAFRDIHPTTRDGRQIDIAANLGSLGEIELAYKAGAKGVGLFRTELLFMQSRSLPQEDEQTQVYHTLATAFRPHPVIIRTLDIGGDKPVAGIDFPREENPFLGWRGVRMCLDRPEIFKPQLRALLRAAVVGNIKVMIPMISDLSEVRRVRELVLQCEAELQAEGVECAMFELGIMIETPAAVLQADVLAAEVSFFSIGTNDLTQYVMATDRANAQIASLYRTEHPAVLKAIELTCQAAQRAGIWVGICGEAAANPELIPLFVAMGVTELSMSPASILSCKKIISEL
jgi:phosphoenolpyruvate-protein phosphotransferase (PTS system enzyme I)